MTVVGLLVAGLFIVGLAVVTSKPFQENMMQAEATQEMASDIHQDASGSTDAAPTEVADATTEKMDGESSEAADAAPVEASEDASSQPADEPPSEVAAADGAPTAADEAAETKAEDAAAEMEGAAAESEAAGAADEAAAAKEDLCCKPGDETPPLELVKQVPPGGLHNPYDWQKLKEEHADNPDYLVKQFRLPGCNECHGGGGGGGFCPALSQGVWFWGNTDDVLFRLISMGSAALEKSGFERIQWGTVKAPMPEMGHVIKTSDHLWKIVSFIRSINPPGTNPPEKVIPGRWKAPEEKPAE
jgi:hypothetical protein